MKKKWIIVPVILTLAGLCLASTQTQPLVLKSRRALDGTFGARAMSHDCLGLKADAARLPLPTGELSFRLGAFSFRYSIRDEFREMHTTLCIGQDIWFGE